MGPRKLNRLKVSDSIDREVKDVNTQEHSFSNHARSIGLLGLWSNTTIIDIKNTIKADLVLQDQKALSMVFQLMFIQLDMAKNIYDFLTRWRQMWVADVSPEEMSWSIGNSANDNGRLQMIASGLWPLQQQGKLSIDLDTEPAQLMAMDWAVSQKSTT